MHKKGEIKTPRQTLPLQVDFGKSTRGKEAYKDMAIRSVAGQIQVAPEATPVLVGGGVLHGRASQWAIFPLEIDRDSPLGRLILLFRREGQHVEEELRLGHVLAVPLHDERAHHDVSQSPQPTRGESCRLRWVLARHVS
jgi:hypothetical protein